MSSFFQDFLNNNAVAASGPVGPYIPPGESTVPGQAAITQTPAIGPNFTPQPQSSTIPPPKGVSADALNPDSITAAGGTAGKLKYTVDQWTYPLGVSGAADLQHYVVFFINVRGKSKWAKNNPNSIAAINQSANGLSNAGLTNAGVGAIGAAGGAAVFGTLASFIKSPGGAAGLATKSVKFAGVGAGAIGGGVAATQLNQAIGAFVPDQSFRIDQAIMLAVNDKPSVTYGVKYDGQELGTLVGYMAGSSSVADATASRSKDRELLKTIAMQAAKIPRGVGDMLGVNLDFADALQVGTATAPNPFREQVFRNVENREFVFKYRFLPRSPGEAQNVQNIIQQFKYHMHPEISTGGLFYIYPSTFDIAYYYRGERNNAFHRISTCVLEKMNVDYGGQGFHTFEDGSPTEYEISLIFRELEVMTKERIQQGY